MDTGNTSLSESDSDAFDPAFSVHSVSSSPFTVQSVAETMSYYTEDEYYSMPSSPVVFGAFLLDRGGASSIANTEPPRDDVELADAAPSYDEEVIPVPQLFLANWVARDDDDPSELGSARSDSRLPPDATIADYTPSSDVRLLAHRLRSLRTSLQANPVANSDAPLFLDSEDLPTIPGLEDLADIDTDTSPPSSPRAPSDPAPTTPPAAPANNNDSPGYLVLTMNTGPLSRGEDAHGAYEDWRFSEAEATYAISDNTTQQVIKRSGFVRLYDVPVFSVLHFKSLPEGDAYPRL